MIFNTVVMIEILANDGSDSIVRKKPCFRSSGVKIFVVVDKELLMGPSRSLSSRFTGTQGRKFGFATFVSPAAKESGGDSAEETIGNKVGRPWDVPVWQVSS